MKIFLLSIIILCFGLIGYLYKRKLYTEMMFLKYINTFQSYYSSNINLFKNNIIEIINNYIIMQKNKNAEYNKIFVKNNNYYSFNQNLIEKYSNNFEVKNAIFEYLTNLGKSDYDYEIKKNFEYEKYLKLKINESEKNYQTKGNLYFKILLAIGAVVAIILW